MSPAGNQMQKRMHDRLRWLKGKQLEQESARLDVFKVLCICDLCGGSQQLLDVDRRGSVVIRKCSRCQRVRKAAVSSMREAYGVFPA